MPCFAYVGAEDNRKGIPFLKIVSLLCKLIQFLMVALSVTVHKALILLVFLNHPYQSLAFRRFLGFFVMHFLFGCCREILNCVKLLKGAILRHFYIKSFCLVTTVCTVDFEIPKFLAVSRTVALLSIM